jgi:hypothetical protein
MQRDQECTLVLDAGVAQLDHRAIVAERISGAEFGHRRKNSFERGGLGSGCFQPEVLIKLAHRVFRLGNAIGHENEAVAGFHLAPGALEGRVGEQPHRDISMRRTDHLSGTDKKRLHMSAIHIFKLAVAPQSNQQHGSVFLAYKLFGEETVDRDHYIQQRHSGENRSSPEGLRRAARPKLLCH